MNNTRKNKIICYTGIDSKKNGKHSIEEYRKITRKICKKFKKVGMKCPKDIDDNGWIKYFGAKYATPDECNAIVKNNKKTDILVKKVNNASNTYHNCKTRKCSKIEKERLKEYVIFEKEQNKACPQKSSDAFYKCSIGFYNNSKYKTLSNKYDKCGQNKCPKEFKNYKKASKKMVRAVLNTSLSKSRH